MQSMLQGKKHLTLTSVVFELDDAVWIEGNLKTFNFNKCCI